MPTETGGVVNGQAVDQAVTNPAFINANGNDNAQGIYDYINTDPASGPSILNVQREWNAINSWMGKAINIAYNSIPTFTNSEGFTASQTLFDRIEAISQKFVKTTLGGGHSHDGSDGGGAPVQAASLDGVILRGYVFEAPIFVGATGTDDDVSADFAGKFPSGGDTLKGVVVLPPNNRLIIRQGSGASYGDAYVDAFGNVVYGRLTESAGVWTLSYFVDLSGTETAYSFAVASDLLYYPQELFNPIVDAPVYSEYASIPSENATSDVIDATATQRGLMSAGTQTLGGNKTWNGTQLFQAIATFVSNVIMQAKLFFVTSTDAATTGSLATMPAPATTAVRLTDVGLVSIETISGGADGLWFIAINKVGADVIIKDNTGNIRTGTGLDFTWKSNAAINFYYNGTDSFFHMIGGGGGGVGFSLAVIGGTPNANGASYNSGTGVFNLQPADVTFGGVMTTIAQAFAGAKTWTGNMILQAIFRLDTTTDSSTTGSNADLPAPSKGVLRLTNASLVSIQRVLTMGNEQVSLLMNKTGVNVTLINNFGADGFFTGTGADFILKDNASVWMVYDSVSSRVMLVGGAGGGGLNVTSVQTIAAAGTITTDQNTRQLRYVKGSTNGNACSITPFGTGGWVDGTEIFLYGESDTDYLDIPANDSNYGVVGNFTSVSLTNNRGMRFIWKNSALRWLGSPI